MITADQLSAAIAILALQWSQGDPEKLAEAEEILRRTPALTARSSNGRQNT
jgi:hypothetical protein